jgi:hypothetical protein
MSSPCSDDSDQYDDAESEIDEQVDEVAMVSGSGDALRMVITQSPYEYDQVTLLHVEILLTADQSSSSPRSIGALKGQLIDRDMGDFFMACDAVSQELQEFSVEVSNDDGDELREPLRSVVRDPETAGSGSVLYIEQIDLDEKYRGSDLSLLILRTLFDHLLESCYFTLVGLCPAPWGPEDRRRDVPDPARGAKVQRIAALFARLGFAQIGQSNFMYLEIAEMPSAADVKPSKGVPRADVMIFPAEAPKLSALDAELTAAIGAGGSVAQIEAIVSRGADPAKANAMHFAAAAMNLDVLRWLVEIGGDMECRDVSGQTPLMIAASLAKGPSVEVLLAAGADVSATDATGMTALKHFELHQQNVNDFEKAMGVPAELTNKVWPRDSARGKEQAATALCKRLLTRRAANNAS